MNALVKVRVPKYGVETKNISGFSCKVIHHLPNPNALICFEQKIVTLNQTTKPDASNS